MITPQGEITPGTGPKYPAWHDSPAKLGLPADPDGYQVRGLWGGQSTVVGGQTTFDVSSAGKISAVVPPEGVALYRVTPLP